LRPLYRLDRLAARPDAPVLGVEGETCCDISADFLLSHVAITWLGGATGNHQNAGAVGKANWTPVRERRAPFVFWPDNDAPGARAALDVAAQLGRDTVKIVVPDSCWAEGYDIGDAISDGLTPEAIDAIIRAAVPVGEFERIAAERWPAKKKPPPSDNELQSEATKELVLPVIRIEKGCRPWIVDAAEKVIACDSERWGLYRNGELLTHVSAWTEEDRVRIEKQRVSGQLAMQRPIGVPILTLPTSGLIDDIFGRAIYWLRFDERKQEWVRTDCPTKISKQYLERGNWQLPELTGIITAPIVRTDGSILTKQGFDRSTGLLLRSPLIDWTAPVDLSQSAAQAAARRLSEPFAEFPFSSPAARSVVVSGILTGLQRRLLPTAPGHGFDANHWGAGKTLLADCISIIVTGAEVPSISVGESDEVELAKMFTSVLMAGDQVVLIDNISRPFNSDTFATILTKTLYQGRILGINKMAHLVTNCLFILTGNNLTFLKDMPRRVLVARIEVEQENPDTRGDFAIHDLKKYCAEHRQQLVNDALTVLGGFAAAGRPSQNLTPYGSFEVWSNEIRSAMVWAGLPDPCETRKAISEKDPERESTLVVFEQWYEHFKDSEIHTHELIEVASVPATNDEGEFRGWLNPGLRFALEQVASKGPGINAKALGMWCHERVDRLIVSDGQQFQLKKSGSDRLGSKWRMLCTTTQS
jgi:hypothetical protein